MIKFRCYCALVLAVFALTIAMPAQASPPWNGDWETLEQVAGLFEQASASHDLPDADLEFLIDRLSDDDVVIVALCAYTLGQLGRNQDAIRAELSKTMEQRIRESTLVVKHDDLAVCFIRIALLESEILDAESEVKVRRYRELLASSSPSLQFWAARALREINELEGTDEALQSVAGNGSSHFYDEARSMLRTAPGKNRPAFGTQYFLVVYDIIRGQLQFLPGLGWHHMQSTHDFAWWKGHCAMLGEILDILKALRGNRQIPSDDQDMLITLLQTDEPVVAALAAYCLGQLDGGEARIDTALQQRMETVRNARYPQAIVEAHCRLALAYRSASSASGEDLASQLKQLAFNGPDFTAALALERLVELGHLEGVEQEIKKRSSKPGHMHYVLAPVAYMIKYPNRPRIYSVPMEFETIERLIDGAPTPSLCADKGNP